MKKYIGLVHLLFLFISEYYISKNFEIMFFGNKNHFMLNTLVTIFTKCESLLLHVVHFYIIFMNAKISCLSLFPKPFINSLM